MKKIISTIAALVALQFYCEAQNTFPEAKPGNPSKHDFANKSLSNLVSPTSVNVNLLPGTNASKNLGSSSKKWNNLYLSGSLMCNGDATIKDLHMSGNLFSNGNATVKDLYLSGSLFSNSDATINGITVGQGAGNNGAIFNLNTAVGEGALNSNISSILNVAFGYHALYSNTMGIENTAIGAEALYSNVDGRRNTATGTAALYSNITGQRNTAIGYFALFSNTTGNSNIATGDHALPVNTSGNENVAYGNGALFSNITGDLNTAIGNSVLVFNTTGSNNTAGGADALASNTTGHDNVALGFGALSNNTTGSFNSGFGRVSNVASGNLTNATAIGNGAIVNNSNKVRIGDANVIVVESAAGSWTVSDERFKTNIKEEVKGLEFIKLLRPVVYNFDANKYEQFVSQNLPDSIKAKGTGIMNTSTSKLSGIRQTGLIAQEVELAAKKSGYNFSGVHAPESSFDNYSISYEKLVVPLIKATQELSAENEILKSENDVLKTRIDKIEQILSINSKPSVNLSNASLNQSVPNPNSNSTRITYNIPGDIANAQLIISDMGGKEIKQIQLNNNDNGVLNIDTSKLSTGTYSYSLFVDGKLIETKKMIVVR